MSNEKCPICGSLSLSERKAYYSNAELNHFECEFCGESTADGAQTSKNKEHERIYLEPQNDEENYRPNGRQWCGDNVWDEGATEYVRADLAKAGIEQLRAINEILHTKVWEGFFMEAVEGSASSEVASQYADKRIKAILKQAGEQ
jgi:hypothetical protein